MQVLFDLSERECTVGLEIHPTFRLLHYYDILKELPW